MLWIQAELAQVRDDGAGEWIGQWRCGGNDSACWGCGAVSWYPSLGIWVSSAQTVMGGAGHQVGRYPLAMGETSHLSGWEGDDSECLLDAETVVLGISFGLPSMGGEAAAEVGEELDLGGEM